MQKKVHSVSREKTSHSMVAGGIVLPGGGPNHSVTEDSKEFNASSLGGTTVKTFTRTAGFQNTLTSPKAVAHSSLINLNEDGSFEEYPARLPAMMGGGGGGAGGEGRRPQPPEHFNNKAGGRPAFTRQKLYQAVTQET